MQPTNSQRHTFTHCVNLPTPIAKRWKLLYLCIDILINKRVNPIIWQSRQVVQGQLQTLDGFVL